MCGSERERYDTGFDDLNIAVTYLWFKCRFGSIRFVSMAVVKIGHMVVIMHKRFVAMAVTVCPFRHRLMRVGVMPVVVAMGIFVF